MKVRIKGYYDFVTFELAPVKDIGQRNCTHIRFCSRENVKKLFDFYKNEMQQGEKPDGGNVGRSRIAETGFFDRGYKHWNEFKEFIPQIIYQAKVIDKTLIEINPIKEGLEDIEADKILNV